MDFKKRIFMTELFDSYQNLLPQSQRQALHLFLIEDLSIVEIAKELATTRQAILDAIKKGAKKLTKIHQSIN